MEPVDEITLRVERDGGSGGITTQGEDLSLDFDPAAGSLLHDKQANRMLARECRKPFVVPENV